MVSLNVCSMKSTCVHVLPLSLSTSMKVYEGAQLHPQSAGDDPVGCSHKGWLADPLAR